MERNNVDYNQILWPRILNSILWTIILHAYPLALYVALVNINVLHPLDWIRCIAASVFNLYNWLYLLPLYALLAWLGIAVARDYTTPRSLCTSRFQLATQIFSGMLLQKGLNYMLLGLLMPYLYLKLNNNTMTVKCTNDEKEQCLHEQNLFIVCAGMWTGIYFYVQEAVKVKITQFPVIQQLKFLQIRHHISKLLYKSVKEAVYPMLYFVVFYYLYGRRISSTMQSVLGVRDEMSITSVSGLFNLPLFAHTWLMSTIIYFTINILMYLFEIHMMEHHVFSLTDANCIQLAPALGLMDVPIIQKLAYYDLYMCSVSSKTQRSCIFTLSQPGGHPHLWNNIVHECFRLINNVMTEVDTSDKVAEPKKETEPVPKHVHPHDFEMTQREQDILYGPVPLSPTCKLRSLVEAYQPYQVRPPPSKSMLEVLNERLTNILPQLCVQPGISYIFGSYTDVKLKHLLTNSEPVVWASLSLAELSACAISEDQFGIVLKDLPAIINLLLQLKQALDKIGKLNNVKKFQKKEHYMYMRDALKSAVRRSLYKIAIAYADYLDDLLLPQDNLHMMKNFVGLRES